ncbi:MAG: DUF4386 domain-containing protein [Propionicimonas sp.]
MTTTAATSQRHATRPELVRTARLTGLLYLGLAITGMLGYLLVRNQLYVADDAQATLNNLTNNPTLARLGIVLEMGVVITQALVALWFYRLFARVNTFAAGSLAAFGLINATAILASAALLATAFDVSQDPSLTVTGGTAATTQLLYAVSGHLWMIGGIFFGLWLIPMGWLALRSGWMPAALGWILMIGGVGYVANALLSYLLVDAGLAVELLTTPATIGELWMVGYLGLRGVRRTQG